jgi:pyridoxal phosphate enzyme (YggS family)
MTTDIEYRLNQVRARIAAAERIAGRPPGSVQLLAVSKTRTAEDIRQAIACHQTSFGENYVQEAEEKIRQVANPTLEWHFIGRIQSNKTSAIARCFDWVHCLADARHAHRLNDQRPAHRPPLKVCIQINISREPSKAGLAPEAAPELLALAGGLPKLDICGLMAIPALSGDIQSQRRPFAELRALRDRLASPQQPLATLSMGMSADLEAAILEGATLVRVGTAIFGPRA